MANYWAITIGINQYRHLQPLMHAQNDALFVHRFLTETVGIPTERCVLLSDLATSVGHQVVYPDKPALSEWIQTITQQVGADDVLWVFFSGYGVQLDGADYLMPIDGDPGRIKETGLAAADFIETLTQLPTSNILMVLDINRSQGSFSGQTIGQQAIDLAQSHQLPLLLSCQPEQYSHETFGVRHGLFTAALLEALQQKSTTLRQISEYVNKRLPELCEHHWRPIQNPVSIIPESQLATVVVPDTQPVTEVDSSVLGTDRPVSERPASDRPAVEQDNDRESATVLAGSTGTLIASAGSTQSSFDPAGTSRSIAVDGGREKSIDTNSSAIVPAGKTDIVPMGQGGADRSAVSGARLRNWGLAALALLMLGVLLKQPFTRTAWQGVSARITALTAESSSEDSDADADAESGTDSESAAPVAAGNESAAPTADEPAVPPAAATPTDESTAEADRSEADDAAATERADTASQTAATRALIAQANTALEQRQYSEALIALQQVPQDQRDSSFSSLLTRARAGSAEAEQYNASVLTDARTSIQPTQASQFTDAIAKARLIQPGEPYYEEAQADIRSWSQIILDIAEGRATSGNLNGAIDAANVMPRDNGDFYQKAQERIVFWQQRQQSREIIAAAQAIPRSGQASTYQQGIVKLSEVPIEHPEYETAQRLADEWSDRIFSIAQARAAQGRRREAIQAAVLVPAGTTAYEPTQAAIKRWQEEE